MPENYRTIFLIYSVIFPLQPKIEVVRIKYLQDVHA